jgi:hypothetical protein
VFLWHFLLKPLAGAIHPLAANPTLTLVIFETRTQVQAEFLGNNDDVVLLSMGMMIRAWNAHDVAVPSRNGRLGPVRHQRAVMRERHRWRWHRPVVILPELRHGVAAGYPRSSSAVLVCRTRADDTDPALTPLYQRFTATCAHPLTRFDKRWQGATGRPPVRERRTSCGSQ